MNFREIADMSETTAACMALHTLIANDEIGIIGDVFFFLHLTVAKGFYGIAMIN